MGLRRGLAGVALAAAATVAVTGLAGCSGAATNSSQAGGSAGAVSADQKGIAEAQQAPGAMRRSPDAPRPAAQTRAVVRTGSLALVSKHPDRVRQEIDTVLVSVGGTVDREDTRRSPKGVIEHSTLVLRVPVARFAEAVHALGRLGRVETSESSSKDVTTELIDVGERVQTLRTSIDRLQKFQRRSTDADTLIRYEREIADRQAELQSLVAQRDYLAGQAAMATLTVTLSTPATYVPPPDRLKDAGFWTGLRAGWNGLVDTVVVVLTAVGAVLPFAGVVAVGGVPVWLLVRRLRARRTPTPAADEP
jgi:hypothetical protein